MNNEIKQLNTRDVAVKSHFYRLLDIGDIELAFLHKAFVDEKNPLIADLNRNWIALLTFVQDVKSMYKKSNIPVEIANEINELEHNLVENIHTDIENSGIKFLQKLREKDTSFFIDSDEALEFIHYLLTQYFRTKKQRDNISKIDTQGKLDFSKIFNILAPIFTTTIGMGIYSDRDNWELLGLENVSTTEFITSDQPIINLYANYLTENEEQLNNDQLEFYYPISPTFSVVFKLKDKKFTNYDLIDDQFVSFLNQKIYDASHEQVFASCKDTLSKYLENQV
jgi:hypothetical protein